MRAQRSVRRLAVGLAGAVGVAVMATNAQAAPAGPAPGAARFTWQLTQLRSDDAGAVMATNFDEQDEGSTSPVLLDACSTGAGTGATYTWTFGNGAPALTSGSCSRWWNRPLSSTPASVLVTLKIQPSSGSTTTVTHRIGFQDLVVASIGDSAASGEGAPESPGDGAGVHFNISEDCDRSGYAANALAAYRLQQSMPEATVHYWDLTCAGARITKDDSEFWGAAVDEGGVLDSFSGVDHTLREHPLPPQVDRLGTLRAQTSSITTPGGLPISRLLLMAGANDVQWATVASTCLRGGVAGPLAEAVQLECLAGYDPHLRAATRVLPAHFDRLRERLAADGISASRVYVTEYFDPLDSRAPQPAVCLGEMFASHGLRSYAVGSVYRPLQQAIRTAAADAGWGYIDGVEAAFQGHGVCTLPGTRWINSVSDSRNHQGGSVDGTWHANRTGHRIIADLVYPRALSALAQPQYARQPAAPAM